MLGLSEGSCGGRTRSGRRCLTPLCLRPNLIYVFTDMISFPEHFEGEDKSLYSTLRGIFEAMRGDDRVVVCQCGVDILWNELTKITESVLYVASKSISYP